VKYENYENFVQLSVLVLQKEVNVCSKDHNLLLLGLRIVAYYENRSKRINTLCEELSILVKLQR